MLGGKYPAVLRQLVKPQVGLRISGCDAYEVKQEDYEGGRDRGGKTAVDPALVPWAALCKKIAPHFPKAGTGRRPVGLERMLRIHFIQHWFKLADLACKEALYDSPSLRRFVGIDLGCEPVSDATTMLKFRNLLNDNKLGEALFTRVGKELQARGIKVNTGNIVDATIINTPSSTKNAEKARDPEMHQTRKGLRWYYGMKLHIGVDGQIG